MGADDQLTLGQMLLEPLEVTSAWSTGDTPGTYPTAS